MKIDKLFIKLVSLKDRWPLNKKITATLGTVLLCLLIYILIPLPDPLFKQDYGTVVADENGEILRAFLNERDQWHFPPQREMKVPKKLETAILIFEDRHFYKHPGVNPAALTKAMWHNVTAGEVKSGASTITMQVIRLAFQRKRTMLNKGIEILQALKLETRYSKKEILKMYVDHAPYGGNIVGYYAASMKYFNRSPDQLTWSQAATLAVLPNAPGLISPLVNRDRLIEKKNNLLKRLLTENIIDKTTYEAARREPVPDRAESFFLNAPHLAQHLKYEANNTPTGAHKFIRTTILKRHQIAVENMVTEHMHFLNSQGIQNGAVLVAETQSGKIRAYVGSQDFFDNRHGGQVDGVKAGRSSGSILKPFLYALAMDEGLVLPSTVIRDIPSYFGTFSPTNADRRYNGLVTAKEALIRSLNVPAVRLLNTYGHYKFYIFLEAAGLTTLFRQPDDYGLTLVLGGAETNLWDLVKLYRGLGNDGRFEELKITAVPNTKKEYLQISKFNAGGERLLSAETCYLTLEMLKELKRPGAEYYWDQYASKYPIAWKTGTSYGQRDGWAVGVNRDWTVGVWVGNFDGEGNPNLSGASCAAPLMLEIFNHLPKHSKGWFSKERLHFTTRKLCLDTGYAATSACPKTFDGDTPKTTQILKQCPYHKHIYVNAEETHAVCALCWEPGNHKRISITVHPPEVAQYLRLSGFIPAKQPPHKEDCIGLDEEKPIRITYPVHNALIWLPRDFNGKLQKITLQAAHRSPNRKIFWYLNNIYKGSTQNQHKLLLQPNPGPHTLELIDDAGNRVKRKFTVKINH